MLFSFFFYHFATAQLSPNEAKMAMASMKTCTLDPLPSSILLVCIEELLPVISRMVNVSLEHAYFADDWKRAVVHPLLKKSGLQLITRTFGL